MEAAIEPVHADVQAGAHEPVPPRLRGGVRLIGGERGLIGSMTGTPFENEKTLDFSVLAEVRPMSETMPASSRSDFTTCPSGSVTAASRPASSYA